MHDGTRKLVAYLESWDSLQRLLGSAVAWDGHKLSWCRHRFVEPTIKKKTPKADSSKTEPLPKPRKKVSDANNQPLGSSRAKNKTKSQDEEIAKIGTKKRKHKGTKLALPDGMNEKRLFKLFQKFLTAATNR